MKEEKPDHPETCVCKLCKPRSDSQQKADNVLRWRGAMRARMESLPLFQEDFRYEENIDPYIDHISPDELTKDLAHESDSNSFFRGDYLPHEIWDQIMPKGEPDE